MEFSSGETTKEFRVLLGEDDIFPAPNKSFEVYLASSPGVYLSPFTYTVVTILNDDPDLPGMCVCVCVCVRVCVHTSRCLHACACVSFMVFTSVKFLILKELSWKPRSTVYHANFSLFNSYEECMFHLPI